MNEYYSKLAGEEDALSAFGLVHGTPRPPPTWAQGWLETARKNGTKNLTIPSMREKKAFEPISMAALGLGAKALLGGLAGKAAIGAGTGLGLHMGSNLLQKGLRRWAPGLGQRQFASGLAHGLEGKKMHPIMDAAIRYGAGPEYLAQYGMGQLASKQVAGMSPAQRDAYLHQAGSMLGETKHLAKAPIIGDMPGGIAAYRKGDQRWFHKLMPTVAQGAKTPWWQKAVVPAMAAGATALNPAAALHWGPQLAVNTIRDRISKSFRGKKFMANELAQGARGVPVSAARKHLTDLLLSPAVNAPRDIGLAANKEYGDWHNRINQWAAEHGHGPVPLPGAGQVTDFAEGVYDRLKTKPLPDVPPPGSSGALGKMMLAGGGLYALNKATQRDEDERR